MRTAFRRSLPIIFTLAAALLGVGVGASPVLAQSAPHTAGAAAIQAAAPQAQQAGGEANLVIPDLTNTTVAATFFGSSGRAFLMWGLLFCVLGLVFGLVIYARLKAMPVHSSMRAVSELIYETCKTYLIT
ncbi:MAG TPA: hypothetical protein VN651_00740, partial [Gemmatimonadaceae bacterium]|nr:hypothetical protein [Gemmatimonadaceae bacterium]